MTNRSLSQMYSCVDATDIARSPLNTSTAKNLWSFSRSQRFPNSKSHCASMHDIPSTRMKRSTSFGYDIGKHRHNVTPSPDKYNLSSFVEENKRGNKGFGAGMGRDQIAPMSYIEMEPVKMPGPGRYHPKKNHITPYIVIRPGPNHGMSVKTAQLGKTTQLDVATRTTQQNVPGPGTYQSAENISSAGRYFTTKHENTKSALINPIWDKKPLQTGHEVPGPGSYHPRNNLSADGHYVLSTNKSAGRRIVLKSARQSFVDSGRGKKVQSRDGNSQGQESGTEFYRLPSDFGHYDQPPMNNISLRIPSARSRIRP